jgi:energy-coupling factor transport system permease protein
VKLRLRCKLQESIPPKTRFLDRLEVNVEDFELMRQITIGQYLATGSILHRLDPRTKILAFGLLILAVVILPSLTALFAALLIVLGCVALARLPLAFATASLRPALPILLFLAALQLLFGWGARGDNCTTLWSFWVFRFGTCSVMAVLSMLLRLSSLILLTGLLSMTSTLSELNHGMENLIKPFSRIGLPAHELALTFTLALRFVPTLAEELEKLLKAQAARGADIRLGSNPVQRVRHFLPVLVPLFVNTLDRGEELAEAMEARGYTGGTGRTQYNQLVFNNADAFAIGLTVMLVAGLFLLPFASIDQQFILLLTRIFIR